MAVVKADAYGHGFMDVSRELDREGITAFGVAFLAEGIQLRKAGIDRPVLLLGGIYPGQERKCIGFNISTVVFNLEQAKSLDQTAGKLYRKALVHLKVDTGMGRLGVSHREISFFLRELKSLQNLELEGIISHFASADELDDDGKLFTERQSRIFSDVVETATTQGFNPKYVHLANSAAAFGLDLPFCNLVRPGIALYGSYPAPEFEEKMDLKPVMRLKSRIAMVKSIEPGTSVSYARRYVADRRTIIASVPVGYADGYSRALTNKGEALVRGRRARVAGTVCMDWIMLDVTDVPDVSVGDEVILLGADGAGNRIGADELAAKAGTISYEIFCGISKRVPRVYLRGGR
jgi:alanine racemase